MASAIAFTARADKSDDFVMPSSAASYGMPAQQDVRIDAGSRVRIAEQQPHEGDVMVEVPITIACGNYDRTRAINDGRVKVEGCAVTYLPLYPEEIFHRAFKLPGVRRLRAVVLELHPHRRGRHLGLCRHPGLRVAAVPAFRHLRPRRRRHPASRRTCAASASACRNTRSPRWSGCAA